MAHAPPVPPDQQSHLAHGEPSPLDAASEVKRDPAGGTSHVNLREQGHEGDIAQNTRNHGHRQDR